MTLRGLVRSPAVGAAVGALWLGAVGGGLAYLARYQQAPGAPADVHARWPSDSRLPFDRARPTLVMVAHPLCTCTRASLAELEELVAEARTRPKTYVVFIMLGKRDHAWEQSDLWRRAAAIPGAEVVRDEQGVEAARFGAETSGQTFLYDTEGRLMFSGGTTPGRGHRGDSIGRSAMLAMLAGEPAKADRSSVFGCGLFDVADRRSQEEMGDEPHQH